MCNKSASDSCSLILIPDPVFLLKAYRLYLLWSIMVYNSFKISSEIVLSAKSLLSEYAASWAKQALSNSCQYKCFKLSVSLNFWIL